MTGHNGAGKTTLAEAIIFNTGQLPRLGRVDDGTTISDHDAEEIERKISLRSSLLTGEVNGFHYDVIDTPGYADFLPQAQSALRVADGAVVVIDAGAGVDVGTERVWQFAEDQELPRLIFLNKLGREDADVEGTMEQVRERFGREAVALQMPVAMGEGFKQIVDLTRQKLVTYTDGKASEGDIPADLTDSAATLREYLMEAIAETDEELMEAYFGEGELDTQQMERGLRQAIATRQIFPVLCGDAFDNVGVDQLLSAVATYFPSPSQSPGLKYTNPAGDEMALVGDADQPLVAFVFKTTAEQHVGELSYLRLYSGTLTHGDEVLNSSRNKTERIGQIFELHGHERQEVDSASAGDIVALVKLKDTHTGNTLCAKGSEYLLPNVESSEPLIRVAVTAKEKGGEDRMVTGLHALAEEDPSFSFRFDGDIRQSILAAQGELHMESLYKRLRERYGVEVETEVPRIPYRETIRVSSDGSHRHRKQSGGRGQFAEVQLKVAPKARGEGFEFLNNTVGGSIPSNFVAAVEKGLRESLIEGPLSSSQVIDLSVSVFDGKHHAVDSDEVSFKIAASQAFRDAFLKAKPVLLEPIYLLTITVPEEFMGDVMGDLTSRRGRISGTDSDGHFQIISAEVPLAEIDRYATRLRSVTHGKGVHTQKLAYYQDVPADVQATIIAANAEQAEAA
ncbi:MAG: elongation factor G [Gemmatimonadetes bacterium]|nr:elongation factor G [Gemmatimonadota bacterium]MBT5143992.1 elongation factor G [Gemmatimonadota bacterium]MBT5588525.1 elongation factor G [Gemmatimonadota bacterium]MBT5961003.1 elongation factor G [Gemmatimonadota bacterium]MBT7454421.1 elongation factor G [Gemmatimonadota bacterium]